MKIASLALSTILTLSFLGTIQGSSLLDAFRTSGQTRIAQATTEINKAKTLIQRLKINIKDVRRAHLMLIENSLSSDIAADVKAIENILNPSTPSSDALENSLWEIQERLSNKLTELAKTVTQVFPKANLDSQALATALKDAAQHSIIIHP